MAQPKRGGSGGSTGHHPPKSRKYRDYDSTEYRMECAHEPGAVFDHPGSRPYDGWINSVSWCINRLPCGSGRMAVHLYVGDSDRGKVLEVHANSPKYGCTHIDPQRFQCGEPIKLVAKVVPDFEFCPPCGITVTLAHCKKYRRPKREKCPEVAEFWNAGEQPVPGSPDIENPVRVTVDLDTARALPPTPHITAKGGGVFGLRHGVYKIDFQVGAKSPQSTDVIYNGAVELSDRQRGDLVGHPRKRGRLAFQLRSDRRMDDKLSPDAHALGAVRRRPGAPHSPELVADRRLDDGPHASGDQWAPVLPHVRLPKVQGPPRRRRLRRRRRARPGLVSGAGSGAVVSTQQAPAPLPMWAGFGGRIIQR